MSWRVSLEPRSLEWSAHWLLALPVFAAAAWDLARRWQAAVTRPALRSVGLGVLLGEVVEPLGEMALFGDTLAEVYEPARNLAFATFMAAGVVTLVAALWAFGRRRPETSAKASEDFVILLVRIS